LDSLDYFPLLASSSDWQLSLKIAEATVAYIRMDVEAAKMNRTQYQQKVKKMGIKAKIMRIKHYKRYCCVDIMEKRT
jgi:hypothetical protein